jgi:hypothetical protein
LTQGVLPLPRAWVEAFVTNVAPLLMKTTASSAATMGVAALAPPSQVRLSQLLATASCVTRNLVRTGVQRIVWGLVPARLMRWLSGQLVTKHLHQTPLCCTVCVRCAPGGWAVRGEWARDGCGIRGQ